MATSLQPEYADFYALGYAGDVRVTLKRIDEESFSRWIEMIEAIERIFVYEYPAHSAPAEVARSFSAAHPA